MWTVLKNMIVFAYCRLWLKGKHDLYSFWEEGIEHKYCARCKAEWRYTIE